MVAEPSSDNAILKSLIFQEKGDKVNDEEEKKKLKRIIGAIFELTKLKDWLFTYLLNNHRIPLSWRCDYARIWGEFAQTEL